MGVEGKGGRQVSLSLTLSLPERETENACLQVSQVPYTTECIKMHSHVSSKIFTKAHVFPVTTVFLLFLIKCQCRYQVLLNVVFIVLSFL